MTGTRALIPLAILALVLGACTPKERSSADESPQPAGASAVVIKGFIYSPASLKIAAGESVTWTNNDQILHTSTAGTPESPSDAFDGAMEGPGKTFTHRFAQAGRFPYFCSRHNGMRGEIVVE